MIIKLKSGLIYTLGAVLLLIGMVGLFLPILQGLLFIALGLYVLSLRSERARKILERILKKFPFINDIQIIFVKKAKSFAQKMHFF